MTTPQSSQKQAAAELLRAIDIFADLRDDQLQWFVTSAEERTLSPGDVLLHEGDPAEMLFVLLEGEIRGRRENGAAGCTRLCGAQRPGDRDMLPFSRMTRFPMTARATVPSRLLGLHKDHFDEMLQRIPELLPRLIGRHGRSNTRIQPGGAAARQVERAR